MAINLTFCKKFSLAEHAGDSLPSINLLGPCPYAERPERGANAPLWRGVQLNALATGHYRPTAQMSPYSYGLLELALAASD